MGALSDRQIAALRRKRERYEVWDGDGLGVRVTPRGIKTFVLMYRFNDKARRLTLGRYRSVEDLKAGVGADGVSFMTLIQARRAALTAKEQIEQGIDPGAEKQASKEKERKAETVEELAALYIDLYAKAPSGADKRPRKRTWKEDERILKRDVVPVLGKRKAKSITRPDIIALLDGIAARGAPIMANRTRAVLSKMFRWAIPRGHVETDPTALVEKPGKEQKRERALKATEIKKFWKGLDGIEWKGRDGTDYSEPVAIALRLLLVTVQRRGEVAGIETSELDEAGAVWTIPGSRTKNGKPHVVPLSDLALDLIRQARRAAAKIEGVSPAEVRYLFPGRNRKGEPVSMRPDLVTSVLVYRESKTKPTFAEKILGREMSPHDLRRTAHTLLGGEPFSVPRFIRDRIINHSDSTPGAHYDRHEYFAEKKAALTAWGDHLAELVGQPTGKVVAIGRRRK